MLVQNDDFGDLQVTFTEDISLVPFTPQNLLDQSMGVEAFSYQLVSANAVVWSGLEETWGSSGAHMLWQPPLGYNIIPGSFNSP